MTKMKTVKAMHAKFKVTATGKLKRHRQGRRHLLTKKSSKKKHQLEKPAIVSTAHEARYKRLMGV